MQQKKMEKVMLLAIRDINASSQDISASILSLFL